MRGDEIGDELLVEMLLFVAPMNDSGETKAIKIAMGEEEAHKAHISSTKSEMGHALGAAGAIELIISVTTI